MSLTPEVFGLGQCCMDYIGIAEHYPDADGKCEFLEIVEEGGGPVANAMVALARWGCRCLFTGVVGDDLLGRKIRESLDKEGIDTGGLLVRNGSASQLSFIVAVPKTGSRTVFWRRPTGSPPKPEEIDLATLRQSKVLYIDGLFVEASLAVSRAAREAGVKVVVDAGTLREGSLDIARLSDCFIVSESFARDLIGEDRPSDACRRLAELGPSVVGVTLGDKGSVVLHRGRIIQQPPFKVKAIDTTGCGDIFHASFTYGLLKDWDVEQCLRFASWAAAEVSTKLGGRAGIPRLENWKPST